jgi:O-antigen/teichoic acid export membrane protein
MTKIAQIFTKAKERLHSVVLHTFATSAAMLGIGLVNSVLLARWLGPAGRGEIAAAMLWPYWLMMIFSTGLLRSLIYHVAQPNSHPGSAWSTAMWLGVAQSAIAVAVGYLALPLLLKRQSPEVLFASRVYLGMIPFYMLGQYGLHTLQGLQRFGSVNRLALILPLGYLTGTVALHLAGHLRLLDIVIMHFSLHVITFLCSLYTLQRCFKLRLTPQRELAGSLLRYGVKISAGELTSTVNLRLDQMILASLFPAVQLGLYTAAVSAAQLAEVLAYAFRMVVTPRVAAQRTAEGRVRMLGMYFRRYWLVSVPYCVALAVALPLAIPLLLGKAYAQSIPVAEILLLGSVLVAARQVLAAGAQALGDAWLNSKAELVALPVTVITLLVLMPRLGILGAAISSVLAYGTQAAVVLVGLNSRHGIKLRSLLAHKEQQTSIHEAAPSQA